MKKTFLILLVISLSGCVADRKGEPVFEPKDIPGCPDMIKAAAKSLEQMGIDKTKVQTWKDNTLSMKIQPCSACQKLNEAAFILKDEKGVYKAAMTKLVQAVETIDPNAAPPTSKQKKEIGNSLMGNNDLKGDALAGKYINALEGLQSFLISEIHLTPGETRNFVLDNYFIPLMKPDEKTQ